MGQRLIFMLGYVVVLVVAVLPAAAAGALAFFLGHAFFGPVSAAILTAITASTLLSLELTGAVHLLGLKVEKFDLSAELPR
jgi:hypothetical protein